ncbi:hypothetical protein PISMIDRAFT_563292 [Pisolithus microcarpus 441]|uniref:Uncharacterized protein n=1 Tax=Pisolithus microcarpus 441 TaxID=765257 RepID=A0A0C9Z4V1_9AGAM|nr:hypothetical protein PISMIDRAFT_563292 [Pisolithus microcarpus 441]
MVFGPPAPNALAETELQIANTRSATSVRRPRAPEGSQANTPSITLHDTQSRTPKPIIDNPPSDLQYLMGCPICIRSGYFPLSATSSR